jgi:hypothetical protein
MCRRTLARRAEFIQPGVSTPGGLPGYNLRHGRLPAHLEIHAPGGASPRRSAAPLSRPVGPAARQSTYNRHRHVSYRCSSFEVQRLLRGSPGLDLPRLGRIAPAADDDRDRARTEISVTESAMLVLRLLAGRQRSRLSLPARNLAAPCINSGLQRRNVGLTAGRTAEHWCKRTLQLLRGGEILRGDSVRGLVAGQK